MGAGPTLTRGLVPAEGCTMAGWVTNSDGDSRRIGYVRLMVAICIASLTNDLEMKSC